MASERTDLLAGERVVMESTGGLLTLTNCRVRLDGTGAGVTRYLTITLDAVASAGVVIRSHPMLLAMALISIVLGFAQRNYDPGLLYAAGGSLALVYVVTRRAYLTISSIGGEAIRVSAHGMSRSAIVEFVNALDDAKLHYLRQRALSQRIAA